MPTPSRGRCSIRLLLAIELAVVLGLLAVASATADALVLAQAPAPPPPSITDVLNNARNWIMGILALLATLFLTVGGVRYLMAGGNAGEVEKAKQAFKSAGIGYGLTVLAPVVVEILKEILAQPK
ncbi:pilin [Saccharopolyspora elongata]|uniref:TrbC/VIRB2 family protein n=1 Tax=Saccharopolyspora elongata TaxID=2530387 RepID=A0A4R4YIB0_9PSEU|nr:pilin [Saccharopolyspora elongata]TDD43072.1 hypothetical protein E1288_27790 [Saccharopolyspora elongata]